MSARGSTIPFGINNRGQVVGVDADKFHNRGFLWSHGTFTVINCPTAPGHTTAFGINDKGQIVGFFLDHQRHYQGFLRTP